MRLVAPVVLVLTACRSTDDPGSRREAIAHGGRAADASPVVEAPLPTWTEHYVWSRVEQHGRQPRTIASRDLVRRFGSGWPGCPHDGLCTRAGQLTLAFGADGRFEVAWNARGSSDFVREGRARIEGSRLVGSLDAASSCAHPAAALPEPTQLDVPASYQAGALTLEMAMPGPRGWPFVDGVRRTHIRFRRVSHEEASRLRFRACQGRRCPTGCQPLAELL